MRCENKPELSVQILAEISTTPWPLKGSHFKNWGTSERTVYRTLNDLEEAHIIKRISNGNGKGYVLTDKGIEIAEKTGDRT
jgi:CTP-dependent riboflavin kinase